jgi:hypothetical protein
MLMVAASAAVGALVVAGLVAVGPPAEERQHRLDELRAQDLAMLKNVIDSYARTHDALPGDLATLVHENATLKTHDPQSGAPYGYDMLAKDRYRLCATFARDNTGTDRAPWATEWAHGAGRTCFEEVAPVRGPPTGRAL